MKKILVTRRLLRSCEDKAKEIFDANLNLNDELYSQKKLIEMSEGCDGILSALTDKLDADTINAISDRARHGGAEIVKYLKTGSAYYAPSSSQK